MVTREERLSEFTVTGTPPSGQGMEVLCEDGSGTYKLPFGCHWTNGTWINTASGVPIEGRVVGWRPLLEKAHGSFAL